MSKGCVPVNTARSTGWALRTYRSWAKQRNQRCQNQCPFDLFTRYHLQHFADICNRSEDPPNFFDRNDAKFKKLHGSCDCVFRGLHENGVSTAKKSAEITPEENENQLWETGTLNVTILQGLQKAVFF